MSKNVKEKNIIVDRKEGLNSSSLAPIDQGKSAQKFVSLNRKILLLVLPLLVLGFVVTTIVTNIQLRTSLTDRLVEDNILLIETLEDEVTVFLEDKVDQIKIASLSSIIEEALVVQNGIYQGSQEEIIAGIEELDVVWRSDTKDSENSSFIQDMISESPDINIVAAELHRFLKLFPVHSEVFVTDKYGATLGSTAELSDYYQADEGWWQAAWNGGQGDTFISQPEFDDSAGINALLISLPILNASGEIIGVIRSTLNVDSLFKIINNVKLGETGHAILLNQDREMIVDPNKDNSLSSKDLSPELLQRFVTEEVGAVVFSDEQGDDSTFSYEKVHVSFEGASDFEKTVLAAVGRLGWTVVLRQKASEAFSAVRTVTLWNMILGFVITALILLFVAIFTRRLISPLKELTGLAQKISRGNLSETTDVQTNDEIGVLANAFNDAVVNLRVAIEEIESRTQDTEKSSADLQKNIMGFLDVMIEVSEGDLTQRGTVTEDALGNVVDATNLMVEEIGILLGDVQHTARDVGKGANDMISTSALIAKSNETRVDTANRLAEGLKIIANSMQTASKNVSESAQTAKNTLLAAEQGGQAVKDSLEGMDNIREQVDTIATRMGELNVSSKEISEVTDAIHNISSQVSLLALHASLEAAGAGKAGERFSVVATEVAQLADDSSQLSDKVSKLIKGVQEDIAEVTNLVRGGKEEVEDGHELATETGKQLEDIGRIAQRSAELAQEVDQQIAQQAKRLNSINKGLQNMNATGLQSQEVVEQGRQFAENLRGRSQTLLERLGRFVIEKAA